MNTGFMYAMDSEEGLINVGWTDDGARRQRTHELEGWESLAWWPATYDDEKAVHRLLKPFRAEGRGHERYGGASEIYDWITWLVQQSYAAGTLDDARHLPRLPIHVWQFGDDRCFDIHRGGQLSILNSLPPRDRPRYLSDLAELNSESDEWYTPGEVIEPARVVMGSIDTDPASCIAANKTVGADVWYSREVSGLNPNHPWRGNVWLNPPYGRGESSAGRFIERLVDEVTAGNVSQAITCLNLNSMSTGWFRPILETATAHCVWSGRIHFVPPDTRTNTSPTKGTVLSYFGQNAGAFYKSYQDLGFIFSEWST